jgi:hypothetical protein
MNFSKILDNLSFSIAIKKNWNFKRFKIDYWGLQEGSKLSCPNKIRMNGITKANGTWSMSILFGVVFIILAFFYILELLNAVIILNFSKYRTEIHRMKLVWSIHSSFIRKIVKYDMVLHNSEKFTVALIYELDLVSFFCQSGPTYIYYVPKIVRRPLLSRLRPGQTISRAVFYLKTFKVK